VTAEAGVEARTIAKRFGKNLVRSRTRAGISQEELGVRAELHRTEIGVLERGERLPRLDTLIKLAGGLEIEAGEMLEGLHWSPPVAHSGNFESRGDP
jgi:transcriptional regulator with XRE-family HTH domain